MTPVSEWQILNSTSAQLGYTVSFTLVHIGEYRTEDKLKTDTTRTKDKKQTIQNTAEQNYPGSVASYDTRPGNKVGLFYKAPVLTRHGQMPVVSHQRVINVDMSPTCKDHSTSVCDHTRWLQKWYHNNNWTTTNNIRDDNSCLYA